MGIEDAVRAELGRLRQRLPQVTGALVASADGLLIAHDAEGIEPETMAAMSAASLGLGQQIARCAALGDFEETIARAADGYVATFTAGEEALLTIFAEAGANVGLLHHETRPVAARISELVAHSGRR